VGGGIPLIAPLTDDLAANRVLELRAIINGTCNYILTRMASGESLGMRSPRRSRRVRGSGSVDDIDAVDAGDKLCVLLRLASTPSCTPALLYRQASAGSTPAISHTGASSDTS